MIVSQVFCECHMSNSYCMHEWPLTELMDWTYRVPFQSKCFFKGTVHSTFQIQSSFYSSVQTFMTLFFLWNTKKPFRKIIQGFLSIRWQSMGSNVVWIFLLSSTETHTGLEKHDGELILTEFKFLSSFKMPTLNENEQLLVALKWCQNQLSC